MAIERRSVERFNQAARTRFHLALRLGARAIRFVEDVPGRGPSATRRARQAALVGAAGDLVIAGWLARSDSLHLPSRLALDMADCRWAAVIDGGIEDSATQVLGAPLGFETALRHGVIAAVVPLAHGVAGAMTAAQLGRPMTKAAPIWQSLGALLGAGVRSANRLAAQRTLATRRRRLEAAVAATALAARNDAALAAGSDVDLLQRATALIDLGVADPDGRTDVTAMWKADLAARTREEAGYLGDVLRRWQRSRNSTPVLADVVDLRISDEAGRVVLTHHQSEAVTRALDSLALRGELTVTTDRTLTELHIRLGSTHEVVVPRHSGAGRFMDPLPVSVAVLAATMLVPLLPAAGASRAAACVPPAASTALVAGACWRRSLRSRDAAAFPVIAGAMALAAWGAAAATVTRRRPVGGGGRVVSYAGPIVSTGQVVLEMSSASLTRGQRGVLQGGLLASILAGWLALGGQRSWRQLAIAGIHATAAPTFAPLFGALAREEVRRAHAELSVTEAQRITAASEEGSDAVRRFVVESTQQAWRRLDEVGARLSSELRDEVARRLSLLPGRAN